MRILLLLRGSAGCGKSTWIQNNGLKQYTLSADDIRLIIVLVLSCTYASAGANAEKLKEEYKAILYKANSDDFGLSNKEVVDEIQEWNMTLVYYQETRKNIWIRIFYPDVYGEMDTIEYENLKISKE